MHPHRRTPAPDEAARAIEAIRKYIPAEVLAHTGALRAWLEGLRRDHGEDPEVVEVIDTASRALDDLTTVVLRKALEAEVGSTGRSQAP